MQTWLRTMGISCCLLASGLATLPALAESERPKIGLVLSGGGARGIAHIGVLKALEELKVPIDCIAGTSMGSVVGGLYASGYSPEEIEELVRNTNWNEAFTDRPPRQYQTMRQKQLDSSFLIPHRVGMNSGEIQLPLGAVEGQHLDQILHRAMLVAKDVEDFDDLPIPFRAVATDLVTGQEVVLSEGSLPDALRASMSIPGIFSPVELDGRLLVDGGMANNLPMSVARELCADLVIAVDISAPLLGKEELDSVLTVTEQMTNFLTRKNVEQQLATLGPDDVLVVPVLDGFSSADFENSLSIIQNGYDAVQLQAVQLASLAEAGHDRYVGMPSIEEKAAKPFVVNFVEINNDSVINDEIIRSRMQLEMGEPLDLATLERNLDDVYGIDVFQSVTYDLVRDDDGKTGVAINARKRDWGPNYLQFGLRVSDDFSGNSDYTMGAAYTRNALNSLGGELRVDFTIGQEDLFELDFYQPVDETARWFVEPRVYYSRDILNAFLGDQLRDQVELQGPGTAFAVGRNLSSTNMLQAEYRFGRGDINVILGGDQLLTDKIEIGELNVEHHHDTLDNLWFPTRGFKSKLAYRLSREDLGSSTNFEQAYGDFSGAKSIGKNALLLNLEAGYSFDDVIPLERWWELGGFGRLSGLIPEQLAGQNYGLASLAYTRRLNDIELAPVYAGFTLEAGNVWQTSSDIAFDELVYAGSLFLGVDTPVGPFYLAWGRADTGESTFYFYLGNPYSTRKY
ncbi:MAG TPA: patatin-like phospholipase family protein [Xanthomonadales bacterium]|nr:patatin-like phospholipase family protein [Xanthomonadales bacterium]